jgi:hypothetical protein
MFTVPQNKFFYYPKCLLCFDVKKDTIIEAFVRFCLNIIAITYLDLCAAVALFFTEQLWLASPGFLHVEKIQE